MVEQPFAAHRILQAGVLGAGQGRRVGEQGQVERDRIPVTETAPKVARQAPPVAGEIGSGLYSVFADAGEEVEDFPTLASCTLSMTFM